MTLSPWRRKHPPCEDGHGGATPPSASSWALFPPAYPTYASPPFDRSCPAPPSHTLRLLFRRRVLFDLRACRPPVGLFCNVRFLHCHFKSLKHGIREFLQAAPRTREGKKKKKNSRDPPPSRKHTHTHTKKIENQFLEVKEVVVQGWTTKHKNIHHTPFLIMI